jgi:copper chaperone CopZ
VFYGEPVYHTSYHQQSMSNRGPYSRSRSVYPERSRGHLPVLALRVPMCCEKCQEKVKEELEELDGVQDVICDQYNQRVTVTGFVDPHRALRKVKKVKKKSEFFTEGSYIEGSSGHPGHHSTRSDVVYTGNRMVHNHGGYGLTRSNSFGRGLGRLPSFGRVTPYELDDRYRDFEPRDVRRDFASVRRMPSFNRHRYHDAEYISMDDQYSPFYSDSRYVSHHSQRPMYRSQVSFSDIPVTNPYYVQHIDSEY